MAKIIMPIFLNNDCGITEPPPTYKRKCTILVLNLYPTESTTLRAKVYIGNEYSTAALVNTSTSECR